MPSPELERYLDQVLSRVRFQYDHPAIREELEDHIAASLAYYGEREPADAEALCLRDLGDAETVGKALDQAHSPLVGRLYLVTRALLGVLAVLLILNWGGLLLGTAWRFLDADSYMPEPDGAVVYDMKLWETAHIDDRYLLLTRARYDDGGTLVLQYWDIELGLGTWSFSGIGTVTDDQGRAPLGGGSSSMGGLATLHTQAFRGVEPDARSFSIDYDYYGRSYHMEFEVPQGEEAAA